MSYSSFLEKRKPLAKALVSELRKDFEYVSILGQDVSGEEVTANRAATSVNETFDSDRGFVIKVYNGKGYAEYSCNDLSEDPKSFVKKIKNEITLSAKLSEKMVKVVKMEDEPHVERFVREDKGRAYSSSEKVNFCQAYKDKILAADSRVVNAIARVGQVCVSKMFITEHKELEQFYTWTNCVFAAVMREGEKIVFTTEGSCSDNMEKAIAEIKGKIPLIIQKCQNLLSAKHIKPGLYDCVICPDITGLIAHEAFGHGVEMDQFVKHRALAQQYVGEYVASPIVTMHDGASAAASVASYFFDDDGVLAHDTVIIKDGILQTGISDCLSAMELGSEPTGNGRRESYKRKTYTRMTNTFFAGGKDSVEDMIKSIKHGYMISIGSNGMEDPKNWNIQCVADCGQEIVDGKLTNNFVSPVVMSGYVPDLLKSISMVSPEVKVFGSGLCGKGYKEWVRVSDGGPYLKAKVKLG